MTVSTSLWLFTFKTEQVVRQCHHKREAWKKYGGGSVPVTDNSPTNQLAVCEDVN